MLAQWPRNVFYNDGTGLQQEHQLVHGRVNSRPRIPWYDVEFFLFVVVLHTFVVRDKHLMPKLSKMICLSHGWSCSRLFCRIIGRFSANALPWNELKASFCVSNGWILFTVCFFGSFHERAWPNKKACVAVLRFEFTDAQLLSISQFMEKTEFCTKGTRAAKGRIIVEREKHKKTKNNSIANAVMEDMFIPHVNQGRAHIPYSCTNFSKHSTFKSDLVVVFACFDHSVLSTLLRRQAVHCFSRLFQSIWIRGWLAEELKIVHMDDNFEFIDDPCREIYWTEVRSRTYLQALQPFPHVLNF